MLEAEKQGTPQPKIIPGAPHAPILGWRWNYLKFLKDPTGSLRSLYQTYGRLCAPATFDETQPGTLCVFAPEYYQQILSQPARFYSRNITQDQSADTPLSRLGSGLISLNGEQHKRHRRMMMPAFHKKRIEAYRDHMVNVANEVIGSWKTGETRDMLREMERITIGVATKSLFGADNAQTAHAISSAFEDVLRLNVSAGLVPINLPFFPMRRLMERSADLENEILAIIREKRALEAAGNDIGNDMLALLMQTRDEDNSALTDAELVGEINIAFIAGHDTTSRALLWTLFLLDQHPKIFADVLDELESKLHGDAPTVEQLNEIPLLERVIKESMRLLPPGTYTTRKATEPFEIGPYHLPKGTVLVISTYLTHHMPELYPEPEKFLPERWAKSNPSPYEYMPFGAGPRMCIGAPFAMMELKIVLAMILQRYRLSIVPNTRIDRDEQTSLTPKRGMPMTIHAQDRQFNVQPVRGNIHEMVLLSR
jgi:cytochrome P450